MSKRYALIKNGVVQSVILADQAFIDNADPRWAAQYDAITEATDEAEPGATFDGQARAFTRPAFVATKGKDELLEERIAALEAKSRA